MGSPSLGVGAPFLACTQSFQLAASRATGIQESEVQIGFLGPRGCQAVVVNEGLGRMEAGTLGRQLGINKGHSNVAGTLGSGKPLVVVCEPPGVHEGPAFPWGSH